MHFRRLATIALALALLTLPAAAEEFKEYKTDPAGQDAYASLPLSNLQITQGKLPEYLEEVGTGDYWYVAERIRIRLDDEAAEVYLQPPQWAPGNKWHPVTVSARLPLGKAVTGRLWLPKQSGYREVRRNFDVVEIRFKISAEGPATLPATRPALNAGPPKTLTPKEAFLEAKTRRYQDLVNRQVPGASYFRHQLAQISQTIPPARRGDWLARSEGGVEGTYSLFTGGRAVAESLQLERIMPAATRPQERTTDVSKIAGITVREFDWAPMMKKLKDVPLDPLASILPEDQHAVFFPSFEAMTAVLDEANGSSTPVLQGLEPRSEDAMTKERYQRQLGLDMSALGRLLGPAVIGSVAVTGSDPYLRMGSDIAVVFEAKGNPETLRMLLTTQILRNTAGAKGLSSAKASGIADYTVLKTPDRTVSSHVGVIGNAVVVSNSARQMDILARVHARQQRSLASLDEYKFFRDRYKRGEADESALVVLTDATIRRWCSPAVRIGDARRMCAAAVLADAEASHIASPGARYDPPAGFDMGKLTVQSGHATSSAYGTLEFMTPLSELGIEKVTDDEARDYQRWRDDYQNFYRRYFDPIAIRLSVNKTRLAADVTVMPLIEGSMYHEIPLGFAGKMRFPTDAGDPQDRLAQIVIAIDKTSPPYRQIAGWLGEQWLAWIGNSISLYVEEDPVWDEMAKAKSLDEFAEKEYSRLPIAFRGEVSHPALLAVFLRKFRNAVNGTNSRWEIQTYKGQTYIEVSFPEGRMDQLRLYCLTTPALLVSPNKELIHRAIERNIAATQPAARRPATTAPWLGSSAAAKVTQKGLAILFSLQQDQYRDRMQTLAWSALPILNELKRLRPKEDSVDAYTRLFHAKLIEPAGGAYVWNNDRSTYESTVYGSPESPKPGPTMPAAIGLVKSVNLGITFEEDGLRARAQIERTEK